MFEDETAIAIYIVCARMVSWYYALMSCIRTYLHVYACIIHVYTQIHGVVLFACVCERYYLYCSESTSRDLKTKYTICT